MEQLLTLFHNKLRESWVQPSISAGPGVSGSCRRVWQTQPGAEANRTAASELLARGDNGLQAEGGPSKAQS